MGGCDLIKKQTNANQRQCTPQSGISASLFSMPNLVEPQDREWGGGGWRVHPRGNVRGPTGTDSDPLGQSRQVIQGLIGLFSLLVNGEQALTPPPPPPLTRVYSKCSK